METIIALPRWRRSHRLFDAMGHAYYEVAGWSRRVRQRSYLADLDSRMLADVGITPAERDAECAKRFWQR